MARKLSVEVVAARGLLPKDGRGTSSPYAVVEFCGQLKRTRTCPRDLDPEWHERLEFVVPDPDAMSSDELDVEIYHDGRGGGGKNHFLGRVRIYGSQFHRCGEGGVIYFPLEKRSILSWIRGEIGLKICYYDEEIQNPDLTEAAPPEEEMKQEAAAADPPAPDIPAPTETAVEMQPPHTVPVVVVEEVPPPAATAHVIRAEIGTPAAAAAALEAYPPELRKMRTTASTERVRSSRRRLNVDMSSAPAPDLGPERVVSAGRFAPAPDLEPPAAAVDRIPSAYDLVEPMQYLFVRVVRARGLRATGSPPHVRVRSGRHSLRSRPARAVVVDDGDGAAGAEWNQVFAMSQPRPEPTLEISIWDDSGDASFLGGVCFDLSDVPVRDQPDGGPLAPQWYRLESGGGGEPLELVSGDVMVSVWFGTQADDSFPESLNTDSPPPHAGQTRSKVYQSPKLWYLRVSVMEAQDLRMAAPPPPPSDVRVKVQLGSQSARTRKSTPTGVAASSWMEDLMLVAAEPLDEQLVVLVEDRSTKEPALLGLVALPLSSAEQRLDERQLVPSRWFNLDDGGGTGAYSGRIHLRLILEAGYHVIDEAAHLCSDFRPTAKQLWRPPVGSLELGIIGSRGLLPMKTRSGAGGAGKGSTDAYCVAKYGKKWVRTRTVTDSFDPRWNEQYTWQVFDPCTVLTVAVFDNWRMFSSGDDRPDYRIGKVRIRISTLDANRVYTSSYPLLVLLRSGLKKMGEVHLAVRFSCRMSLPDLCAAYAQPTLPRMHYLRPIGVAQQEALRVSAVRTVAAWMARSEPPLGPEVVRYILDADSPQATWSSRRSKANWFRIVAVMAWAVALARWLDGVRRWRHPATTVLVHVLYLVLVWYPELAAPTAALYVAAVGAWYHRFRQRSPAAGMDSRLSGADGATAEELDEEFDGVPSGRSPEAVRARYDRLRVMAARAVTVMGDLAAQGERVQALVSWRDPRATKMFVGACVAAAAVLYAVPAKMVAVAMGFYYLRHPMFRDPMPPAGLNFFRRLPSLSDRLL